MKKFIEKFKANKSVIAVVSATVGLILTAGGNPTGIVFIICAIALS